ncbi:MAG: hypothetical protein ACRDQW_09820 [Haloechinothrix sp.]
MLTTSVRPAPAPPSDRMSWRVGNRALPCKHCKTVTRYRTADDLPAHPSCETAALRAEKDGYAGVVEPVGGWSTW